PASLKAELLICDDDDDDDANVDGFSAAAAASTCETPAAAAAAAAACAQSSNDVAAPNVCSVAPHTAPVDNDAACEDSSPAEASQNSCASATAVGDGGDCSAAVPAVASAAVASLSGRATWFDELCPLCRFRYVDPRDDQLRLYAAVKWCKPRLAGLV